LETAVYTQAVADAFYVLSDPQRRSDYDRLSSSISSSARTSDPNASNTFFSMFSDMLRGEGQSEAAPEQSVQRPNANIVFGTVFEDV
jgi:DnaJ-class molecular chaperone